MYSVALATDCMQGAPCPAVLAPDIIRYHAEGCLSCSDPSEWEQPFLSAPPLVNASDIKEPTAGVEVVVSQTRFLGFVESPDKTLVVEGEAHWRPPPSVGEPILQLESKLLELAVNAGLLTPSDADMINIISTIAAFVQGGGALISGLVEKLEAVALRTGLTRVGRWMSAAEYEAMTKTGIVQEGGGGTTYVARPADPAAYGQQAAPGSRYVEFDVPKASLRGGGKEGWAQIPGPNSVYGRLAAARGEPVPQFPPARNVELVQTK